MEDNEKYQKIDLQAVMEVLLPVFRPGVKIAAMQRSNGIFICIDEFRIDIDQIINISLALYGLHNGLGVSSFCYYDQLEDKYHLCLEGSIYKILPKYYDGKNLVGKKAFILKHEPNE